VVCPGRRAVLEAKFEMDSERRVGGMKWQNENIKRGRKGLHGGERKGCGGVIMQTGGRKLR
jgi:hypothetical protein